MYVFLTNGMLSHSVLVCEFILLKIAIGCEKRSVLYNELLQKSCLSQNRQDED